MSRKARLTKNKDFIKQLIQETELVGMSEKEALEYIEVKLGKSISSQSYYRLKKQVRSDPIRHAWLTYYAKTGFVDHYRDRLREMQMIQKDLLKMWITEISKADNEKDKYLILQIARSIRENNVVLSELGVSLPIISSMKNIMDKSTQMRVAG